MHEATHRIGKANAMGQLSSRKSECSNGFGARSVPAWRRHTRRSARGRRANLPWGRDAASVEADKTLCEHRTAGGLTTGYQSSMAV